MSHLPRCPTLARIPAASLSVLLLSGCFEKEVVREDVVGVWLGRAESPSTMPRFGNLEAHLTLNEDGSFALVGFPFASLYVDHENRWFIQGQGRWTFTPESPTFSRTPPYLRVELETPVDFELTNLYGKPSAYRHSLAAAWEWGGVVLYDFWGDPDAYDRIVFRKED